MKPGAVLRIARPTDHLPEVAQKYQRGLGFTVLGQFTDHAGFDGVILGHPAQPYHIEFTTHRGHPVGQAPSKDHLLVFYLPDPSEFSATCAQMLSAGFREVESYNPYWSVHGRTFADPDDYRVVIQHARWNR